MNNVSLNFRTQCQLKLYCVGFQGDAHYTRHFAANNTMAETDLNSIYSLQTRLMQMWIIFLKIFILIKVSHSERLGIYRVIPSLYNCFIFFRDEYGGN